jgi:hypothetical protein
VCWNVCLINERNRHSYRLESEGDFTLDYRTTFVLSEEPFLSVSQASKKAMMSKLIVCCHLTQIMRWKLRDLQGVLHNPTESEKMNRVQRATKLLELLELIKHEEWRYIVTVDDSWVIERSIGSDTGLQRMISREQGRNEGSTTIKRC